ncbi:MAG TPA: hypothetical protein VHP11_11255 [Tepidisphaeraceae bacterium]|nr:hypothetical protein [Tepidisphaeraceae bacterium]
MGLNAAKVAMGMAGLLGVAGFVMFRALSPLAGVPGTPLAISTTQSTGTGEEAWKTWEIPALVSPERLEAGADAAIADLITRHNANQDRLGKVSLRAQCVWMLDMPGDPRAMTIEFDRARGLASMTCGKDRGRAEGAVVHMSPGSAMNIDALYLLMFRKYNAGEFHAAVASTQPGQGGTMVTARSDRETLVFDVQTGQLVQAEFQLKEGVVQAKFADFKAIDKAGKAMIPTSLDVLVPVDLFPFERTRDGRVTLRIDPEHSMASKSAGQ